MQEKFEEKLELLIPEFFAANEDAKKFKNISESYKQTIKDIFTELDISTYAVNGIRVTVADIEKTSLIEPLVIEYLKQKGLNHLIRTKEYIEEADILMAASKGELDPVDLEPFTSTKIEKRITAKKEK